MLYLNRVILAGTLQDDPEIRYTRKGKPVIFFTLKVPSRKLEYPTRSIRDVSIRVMFINGNVDNWEKKRVKAGENVLVDGGLIERSWEAEGGQMRREIEVIADNVAKVT